MQVVSSSAWVHRVCRSVAVHVGILVLGMTSSDGAPRWATVTGTVARNERYCDRDGPCQLRLRDGAARWLVIYHPGEGEHSGLRIDLVRVGEQIEAGARIRATGRVTAEGAENVLLLLGDQAELRVLTPP